MVYKKTFWMNLFFAIVWMLLCLVSFATDIDYVEYTALRKILTAFVEVFIFITPIITAIYIYKSKFMSHKLVLLGNYACIFIAILLLLNPVINQPSRIFTLDFLVILFIWFMIALPFVINLKAIKSR